jgi:hypothetical protein
MNARPREGWRATGSVYSHLSSSRHVDAPVRAYQRAPRALYIWITGAGHATPSDAERPCRGNAPTQQPDARCPRELTKVSQFSQKPRKPARRSAQPRWQPARRGDLTKMTEHSDTFARISDEVMTGGTRLLASFQFLVSRPVQSSNRSFFSVREPNSTILPIFPGAFLGAELRTPSVAR